jgi:hypothetical protein
MFFVPHATVFIPYATVIVARATVIVTIATVFIPYANVIATIANAFITLLIVCLFGMICGSNFPFLSLGMFKTTSPADKIYIQFEQSTAIDRLSVLNTLGQEAFKMVKPQPDQEIDVSQLPAGIYFLKAENKQGQGVFKLIKE